MSYTIKQGDCLDLMKEIPDKSIDMILADLPYGTTECSWDSIIPIDILFTEYKRIIKINGAIVLFGNEPFSSLLRMSNLDIYRYEWVWIKNISTGFMKVKYSPLKIFENIIVFSFGIATNNQFNSNKIKYYPQGIIEVNQKLAGKKISSPCNNLRGNLSKEYIKSHINYPKNILYFDKDGFQHPTQKPVALLEYLIKTYTLENETVLDNTMGSGSTGVACIRTNRNFIGYELDEKYFNIAQQRIEKELSEVKQTLFASN